MRRRPLRSFFAIALFLGSLLPVVSAPAFAAAPSSPCLDAAAPTYYPQWQTYGGSALHTGATQFVGPPAPTVKWNYSVSWRGYSMTSSSQPPVVGSDGIVYVAMDKVYAFYPNGRIEWSYNLTSDFSGASSPAIASDGTIYVRDTNNELIALHPDGRLRWVQNYETEGPLTTGPDGSLYFGSAIPTHPISLVALFPTGSMKWSYPLGEWDFNTAPAVGADGTVYVAYGASGPSHGSDNLFAISPSGALLWNHSLPADPYGLGTPSVGPDGTIYVANTGPSAPNFYAFYPNGTLKWTKNSFAGSSGYPAIGPDGTIYLGGPTGLAAFTPAGDLKWSDASIDVEEFSSPVVDANGTIYVGGNDGVLRAYSPNGNVIWQFNPQASLPAGSYRFTRPPAIASNGAMYLVLTNNTGGTVNVPTIYYALGPAQVNVTITLNPSAGSTPISSGNGYNVYYYKGSVPTTSVHPGGALSLMADPYTLVNISSSSSASGTAEQWCMANSGPGTPSLTTFSSGPAGAAATYVYYDLLSQSVSYSVVDGGTPPPPSLTYSTAPSAPAATDSPASQALTLSTAPSTVWLRRNSTASVPQAIAGASGERWTVGSSAATSSGGTAQWSITAVNSVDDPIKHYHQYSQSVGFSVNGPSGYSAPVLSYGSAGAVTQLTLGTTPQIVWIDAGTVANAADPLAGSNSTLRWWTVTSSWATTAPNVIPSSIAYQGQYSLTMTSNATGGGTMTPSSDWFSVGAGVTITATPISEWTFASWQGSGDGSYTGTNSSASVTMNSPITEVAMFANPIPEFPLGLAPLMVAVAVAVAISLERKFRAPIAGLRE